MIHRTFRSLDDAPKLVGFTIRQWAALIADSLLVLGFVHLARLRHEAGDHAWRVRGRAARRARVRLRERRAARSGCCSQTCAAGAWEPSSCRPLAPD